MKKALLALLPILLLIACNEEISEEHISEQIVEKVETIDIPAQEELPLISANEEIIERNTELHADKSVETVVQKEKILPELEQKTITKSEKVLPCDPPKKKIEEEKIVPFYDSLKYSGLAVNYFSNLSKQLGGKPYFAEHSSRLKGVIMKILSSNLEAGTDIVLVIDKTGSMEDDKLAVLKSLTTIFEYLEKFKNVKLGIACYGDFNHHHDFWYNSMDLSDNIEDARSFMSGYYTMGNPDTRESVNDAIVKTVREMSWTPGSKRLMLVIGDAPSQKPPFSFYTDNMVIKTCDSMNVTFNLFPVILSTQGNLYHESKISIDEEEDVFKIYPNPARNKVNFKLKAEVPLTFDLYDLTGKLVLRKSTNGPNGTVDINHIPNGNYLIHLYNNVYKIYYTSKLIVKK